MIALRTHCPDCHTLTGVWLGHGYECHSCGRTFPAAQDAPQPDRSSPRLEAAEEDRGEAG